MLVNAKHIEHTDFQSVPSRGGSGHQHQFVNVAQLLERIPAKDKVNSEILFIDTTDR